MNLVHIHPKFKHLETELLECITHFEERGTYVTKGERNTIKSFTIDKEVVNVKSFKTPAAFNSFIYKNVRKSKARRSFEYAERLTKVGILTPLPIAYVENTSTMGLKTSYYVSKQIDYDLDFRVLIHNPLYEDRDAILRQFTQFTYKLHENNVNFLDHSPGNTLIVKNKTGYDFYLIDLNRMRFEAMGLPKRMENLKRLWLSKKMIRIVAEEYARISNEPFEKVYGLLLESSRGFKLKINRKKRFKRKYMKSNK